MATQRAALDGFVAEARPWAMREARRSYRHLPAELHEQAFETAARSLQALAQTGLDRRALYRRLADRLDEELRQLHVGWCLNHAGGSSVKTAPVEEAPAPDDLVAGFIEDSLGGLERAVLQLELGAGRDSHAIRAALRLGPRQYARHRDIGLGKLRGAIASGIRRHVCGQHLASVTLAATGDRQAAEKLGSGPDRCRSCAREAATLERLLQHRLALAPWPFIVKPIGLLALKAGTVAAVLTGKGSAGAGGLSGAGSLGSAKLLAGALASAAIATGGIAAVEGERRAPATPVAAAPTSAAAAQPQATAAPAAEGRSSRRAGSRRRAGKTVRPRTSAGRTHSAAAARPAPSQAMSPAPAPTAQPPAKDPVRQVVDDVKRTVDDVSAAIPGSGPVVEEVVRGTEEILDSAGTTTDSLTP